MRCSRLERLVKEAERGGGHAHRLAEIAKAASSADNTLLRRVRRAMGWVDRIKAGGAVAAIAADKNITGGFINRHIDLALLSPEILAAIMDGRHRADLSARALGRMQWSAHWARQAPVFLEAGLAGEIPCYAD